MATTVLGNYLVEVTGVGRCQAQEVELPEKKNEISETYVGDSELPIIGRGKAKVEELTIKQALGLNNEAAEFARLFDDFSRGVSTDKVLVRVVTLGDDGVTAIATDEYIDCVPTSFKPTGKKSESKDTATFEMKFRPTDHRAYY